jgi:hypothetical protein
VPAGPDPLIRGFGAGSEESHSLSFPPRGWAQPSPLLGKRCERHSHPALRRRPGSSQDRRRRSFQRRCPESRWPIRRWRPTREADPSAVTETTT